MVLSKIGKKNTKQTKEKRKKRAKNKDKLKLKVFFYGRKFIIIFYQQAH